MSDVISTYQYDVFLAYKTDDDESVANEIDEALKKKDIKVVRANPRDAYILKSILRCVNSSKKTLLVLTKTALKSPWIVLEVLHAIEESKRSKVLTLILLMVGVSDDDLAKVKRGILASVPLFCFNNDNWEELLAKNVMEETPLSRILPIEGSLAHGLVISHFTGFLSHVLPELKKKIGESLIFKEDPVHVSRKYYFVLPESCKTYDTLDSHDDQNGIWIEKKEVIEFQKIYAGKPRTFKLTLYKISKKTQKGSETYYFFADNPYVLNAMSSMREMGLAEVDMCLQKEQFYRILEDVVNHAENESCYDTVRIIRFKDNETTMEEALFQAVQSDLAPGATEKINIPQDPNKGEETACDAFITFLAEETRDSGVAEEIHGFLESNNVTVEKAGQCLDLPEANWYIYVLSKKAVKEDSLVLLKYFMLLHEGVCKNELQVLLVIVDMKPEEIPHYVKWVTMVYAEEPKYCEKLLVSMKGGTVRLKHRLPCGDVAIGLAWAYVVNYLRITLQPKEGNLELKGRIRKFISEKNIQCGCVLKMFPVLPKSCTLEDELHKKANEGSGGKEVVKYLGELEPVYQNTGGQHDRPFYLHVYMHTDPESQKSVCFVAEYFTPGHCLHEMAYRYPFAGLHKEDMLSQGERVVSLVPEFLKIENVKQQVGDMTDLVEIIYYNDTKETLLSALERHIFKETHDMVYASDAQQNRASREDK